MFRSVPLNLPVRLVILFLMEPTFACRFHEKVFLFSTEVFTVISIPLLIALAALAYTWFVKNGGCGTPYRYNISLVLSLNTSIVPVSRSFHNAISRPALNDFLTSHFRSGLFSCDTE